MTHKADYATQGGTIDRRARLMQATGVAGALAVAGAALPAAAQGSALPADGLDAKAEARKLAVDRKGKGEKVLMISGFPQTRRSWDRLIPLLSDKYETIPADLPSFADSGFLSASATTENVGKVFHEFVAELGAPPTWSRMISAHGSPMAGRCSSKTTSRR